MPRSTDDSAVLQPKDRLTPHGGSRSHPHFQNAAAHTVSQKGGWIVASILAIALVVSVTSHMHRVRGNYASSGVHVRASLYAIPRGHRRATGSDVGLRDVPPRYQLHSVTGDDRLHVDTMQAAEGNSGKIQQAVREASDVDLARLSLGGSVYCSGTTVDDR